MTCVTFPQAMPCAVYRVATFESEVLILEDSIGFLLLIQFIMLALNAIFASAEIAVISMKETRLKHLTENGNRRARMLTKLVEQPSRFLATIQVSITLSGFLNSAFASDNFAGMIVDALVAANVPIPEKTLNSIAVLVVIFGYILLHKTRTGRTIYAIGGSRSSAELMGLPVKRTQYLIYFISTTLAAVASIVYTANIGSAKNTVGTGWELDAVAAVVIGGTIVTGGFGYVLGSVVGALVRSIIDPLTSDFGVPAEWTTIVVGLMILVFVVLQRVVSAVGKKE